MRHALPQPTATVDHDEAVTFAFSGPYGTLSGLGAGDRLPSCTADSLEARLAGRAGLIGGALPFDRDAGDELWQARRGAPQLPAMRKSGPPVTQATLRAEPSADAYAASVSAALAGIARGDLAKVVLARTLLVEADRPFPQTEILHRIARDPSVTAFMVPLPEPQPSPGGRALIGATPELLVQKSGASVVSHPLAGSAARHADPAADRAARQTLEASDKDRREHAIVVEDILDRLSPLCRNLARPAAPEVAATASMWHLGTRIEGQLKDPSMPSVLIASILHPTPAVCGVPVADAARLIRRLEPVARDFYAGAVGWCDLDGQGDGAWFVAIRCADITGATARLFAGAGIVAGSDPAEEAAETGAKFGAMLGILGLPRDAGMPPGPAES